VPVAEVEKSLWKVEDPLAKIFPANRLEVEAEPVTRSEDTVVEARVEEAVAMRELVLVKTMVVEVAFSPDPRVVNGKAKEEPDDGQLVRQSPETQRMVVEAY